MTLDLTPSSPIGVFDSGLGGLSVLREIERQLPGERIHYVADTANVPYGDKPIEVVRSLALKLTDYLIESGAKIVIMASGTSTAAGLDAAKQKHPAADIIGTIDSGARTAVNASAGDIGVIATNATAQSLAFSHAVHAIDPKRRVAEQGCPRFVPLVETGRTECADAVDASLEYLRPLAAASVRVIILGCTHFPFLDTALRQAVHDLNVRDFQPLFVDPAAETVRDVKALLARKNLLNPAISSQSSVRFDATGDPEEFRRQASMLLRRDAGPANLLRLGD
ncbi:glutamate racemase [Capsulimonas corticalis]|uniref:Glutamate racemase n=1 Tax=Capsulimonas corticalis TaxID=2219043 RepID=A0A402CQC0_9BACT|nr:glutamate racemase [Capsulimonas corticalis]BDI32663.1 glutamate racemase [Capsulimonas corticalis]